MFRKAKAEGIPHQQTSLQEIQRLHLRLNRNEASGLWAYRKE
jgi:hypothetical protein